jgi:hypothetical protein
MNAGEIQIYKTPAAICGQFLAGECVANDQGDYYDLPATLVFTDDGADFRFRSEDRVLGDGDLVDSANVDARDFEVEGYIVSSTETAHQTLIRNIKKYGAVSDIRARYDVDFHARLARPKKLDAQHVGETGKVLSKFKGVWRRADPFWYAATWQVDTRTFTGTTTFTLNTGTIANTSMFPVICITARDGETADACLLRNTTPEVDVVMQYNDPNMTSNARAVIDCGAGTATRDGVNSVRYISGSFMRLEPGDNALQYEGDPCVMSIFWLERFL